MLVLHVRTNDACKVDVGSEAERLGTQGFEIARP